MGSSRENFVENGVDPALISVATGVSTGVAPIFVDASGSNAIVIVPGANDSMTAETVRTGATPCWCSPSPLTPRCVPLAEQVAAAEPAIARASVLVTQNEISRAATLEALRIARRHGVLSIFNPAPAAADFEPELFRLADVVCPNESEAEILCGFPVATPADARAAALQLLQRGPKHVIITLGAAGVLVASSAEGDGDARVEVVPAPAVACVVDTSGAGDCFIGTLAAELAQGADVVRAASVAVRVASVSVTRRGTQSSYPKREELAAGGV